MGLQLVPEWKTIYEQSLFILRFVKSIVIDLRCENILMQKKKIF